MDTVLITKKQDLGDEEMFCAWFECPSCGGKHITSFFKFCPDCGIGITFDPALLKELDTP